jgi:phage terminase small subunit
MSSIIAKPLTKMQQLFCQNYISNGFNAKQAALKAGYSLNVAEQGVTKVMANPLMRQTIEKAIAKNEKGILDSVGASYVNRVRKLWRIVEVTIPDDEDVRQPYVRNAIAAIAELNKMGGDYAPDKSLRLTVDMTKERMAEAKKVYDDF